MTVKEVITIKLPSAKYASSISKYEQSHTF